MLDAFLRLPYEILIPNTLFADELLRFTPAQKQALVDGGLKVIDVPGTGVLRARDMVLQHPQLSINDGFAFVIAEGHDGCILVTGDKHLRQLAEQHNIEAHGVLWIVDELHRHDVLKAEVLATALRLFEQDQSVRLPRRELLAAIRRYDSAD